MAVSTIGQAGLDAPITLTSPTLTSPSISGTPVMGASVITSGTVQASTSGTSIDFTGVPSWVKRVTVMFNGVSTNGSSALLIQLGAGSVTTTGYTSIGTGFSGTIATTDYTTGFGTEDAGNASFTLSGTFTISLLSNNIFTGNGIFRRSTAGGALGAGLVSLSGTLDRVRITTVNGTDTFDAGSINILYE
jgi:hypothetical protein